MLNGGGARRLIGLDVGDKRVGFAFANMLGVGSAMVLPGGFLAVTSMEKAAGPIRDLIEEDGPDEIVVGLPLRDGRPTPQSERIRKVAEELDRLLGGRKKIHFWDESLSSVAAGDKLVEAELKHSGKKKKGRVDAVAATLILQSYVDSHRVFPGLG